MQIKNLLPLLLLSGLAILITLGLLYVVFGMVETQSNESEMTLRLKQYQTSAMSYHSKLTDYSGLCTGIGVDKTMLCTDADEGYRIVARLSDGGLLCADQTGFIGLIEDIGTDEMSCR